MIHAYPIILHSLVSKTNPWVTTMNQWRIKHIILWMKTDKNALKFP